ncbi:MAG: hypothetical protein COW03_07245 [Cytophagales bacterium CG12_big_fil_rev_8_21_14_0_65_40_12]|nr:MAG: hypothetical protein COW03_07245 [Cytophagales bacterium CG12_big_fil_rev_8_21_14_0_65_40_12]PIW05441.1 MAG: hypothetical protein COW40_04630 [Cytophagales bacterium CG17_big_fil_post_rev_8_21_14_2_50_40_13]
MIGFAIIVFFVFCLKIGVHYHFLKNDSFEWESRVESCPSFGLSQAGLISKIKLFKSSIMFFTFKLKSTKQLLIVNSLVFLIYLLIAMVIFNDLYF